MTRSNSIPTHDASLDLYGASPLGSTLSLAERPRSMGMVRSGSFRDKDSDESEAPESCRCVLYDFAVIGQLLFVNLVFHSSRVYTLSGIQRLVKLLLGECQRHAVSGSYNSVWCVVCLCDCVYVQLFVHWGFPPLHTRPSPLPCYPPLLLSHLTSWLLFLLLPKAEERIQGEVSIFLSALPPVSSLSFHLSRAPLLSVGEASLSFITWPTNMSPTVCPHFCSSVTHLFSPQQIRKLRRELESSQEKVSNLTTQLTANVCTQHYYIVHADGWCLPANPLLSHPSCSCGMSHMDPFCAVTAYFLSMYGLNNVHLTVNLSRSHLACTPTHRCIALSFCSARLSLNDHPVSTSTGLSGAVLHRHDYGFMQHTLWYILMYDSLIMCQIKPSMNELW